MRIIRLEAEGFKRLKAVSIAPDGNVVRITGRNGAGKTSVLDAIWVTLAGKDAVQSAPINKDSESARIKLDLGELVVTRTFKREKDGPGYTTGIVVENAEGARYPKPQLMLDGLLSALAFDPLEFARMKPKDQFEALKQFVPDVDFEALERQQKGDFERRADINRRAKEARALADGISVPAGTPDEEVDESALVDELTAATRRNAEIEAQEVERRSQLERAASFRREAERLGTEAGEIEARYAARPSPEPADVTAIRAKVDAARERNRCVALKRSRREQGAKAAELEASSKALTAAMEQREKDKRASIAAAKMPVEGIDFGEDMVLKNGLPFDQASDAEKVRDSVAIAMATKDTKLRVLRIRDGSLLDSASMAIIEQMAAERDYQVWLEVVDESGKVGFVIEDGEVVHAEA